MNNFEKIKLYNSAINDAGMNINKLNNVRKYFGTIHIRHLVLFLNVR